MVSFQKLHPQYVMGFIDGEGSFCVSVYFDKTVKSKTYVRSEFSIELRADDRMILERIKNTIGCGKIYDCNYERYGWYPHVKYKVSKIDDIADILVPFVAKHGLQAKKKEMFRHFKVIVEKCVRKEHLTLKGIEEIRVLREEIRKLGKKHRKGGTARVRENRLPSGVRR
jgi:hypothetical protein